MRKGIVSTAWLLMTLMLLSGRVLAANEEKSATPQDEEAIAFAAAAKAMVTGPAEIKLQDQAVLKLSNEFLFVPQKESAQLLRAWGNTVDERLLGIIFPQGDGKDSNWFAVVKYEKSGYIKDDDAKEWDADELLQGLKEGTEESNKERAARGIPEMEVVGWVEAPAYDSATHRLVWSLSSKEKGAAEERKDMSINYNTFALGREGYISMNLVTALESIESQKPIAKSLLANLEFNEGKRYSDFDAATDTVATYGLAALVGGIAAKKLGLFAVIGAFLLKFAKVIGVAVIGLGSLIFGRFKKNKDPEQA